MASSAPFAARGADDQAVVVEPSHGAGVGTEQRRRLLHHLAEDRSWIQLGGQQASHPGELLRKRARAALGLEELAALECATGGSGEVLSELELVVGERAGLGEEHEDQPALIASRRLDRDGEHRVVAGLVARAPASSARIDRPRGRRRRPRCDAPGRRAPVRRPTRQPVSEQLCQGTRQLVARREHEAVGGRQQQPGEGAAERLAWRPWPERPTSRRATAARRAPRRSRRTRAGSAPGDRSPRAGGQCGSPGRPRERPTRAASVSAAVQRCGVRAVQAEHADQLVEDEDRRGEHGPGAERSAGCPRCRG